MSKTFMEYGIKFKCFSGKEELKPVFYNGRNKIMFQTLEDTIIIDTDEELEVEFVTNSTGVWESHYGFIKPITYNFSLEDANGKLKEIHKGYIRIKEIL